ncbi:uncharacterized protein AB9W97_018895 [Spinachia spinachia]
MEGCRPATAHCIVKEDGNRTQAYHHVSATPAAERGMPGLAVLLGAVGIGLCGYSSRQLALYHRPSSRVLQWVGTHTDASRCLPGDPARLLRGPEGSSEIGTARR